MKTGFGDYHAHSKKWIMEIILTAILKKFVKLKK